MTQVAIVVLADTESHGDLARVVNALQATKEFKEADDDVKLIFDGAGTGWISKLSDSEHKLHPLFQAIRDKIAGACEFCAGAFQAKENIKAQGIQLLGGFEGHPSFKQVMDEGYTIITF